MTQNNEPLVSVLTPVYNGEKFLRQCIESVLNQTYQNWEYIIVNNASTDRTLEIAEHYASTDKRIKIHSNGSLVDVITNHNIAFSQISDSSKYCKLAQTDDLLFPECIKKMVSLAETDPSIGIVSSYTISKNKIYNQGIHYPTTFIQGKEIAKGTLLGEYYLCITPTSLLLDAQHIRENMPYYSSNKLNADLDSLYNTLQKKNVGFVHEILTFVGKHDESVTSRDHKSDRSQLLSPLSMLVKYGSEFLQPNEFSKREKILFTKYYKQLDISIFDKKEKGFWDTQKQQLHELGYKLNYFKLILISIKFHILNSLRKFKKSLLH